MSMTIEEAIKHFSGQVSNKSILSVAKSMDNPHVLDMVSKINEANELALVALKEKAGLEKQPQPLTMAELRNMNGETVYCEDVNADVKIHAYKVGFIYVEYKDAFEYVLFKAKDVTLYRHNPKEDAE